MRLISLMSKPVLIAAATAILVILPPLASGETVRLTTGEVVIGDVTSATHSEVVLTAVFPRAEKLALTADRVDPASHYELLVARVDRDDANQRLALARFCLGNGLFAQAIVEARLTAKLNPSLRGSMERLEEEALESLAQGFLESAKTYVAVEQPERARLYLNSILERYRGTTSAAEAARILRNLPEASRPQETQRITSDRQKQKLRRHLERAQGYVERADERTASLSRHFQAGKDENLLQRAAHSYKKAYALLREGARSLTDDEALNQLLLDTAATARGRLTKTNLELGRLALQRGSILAAEEYCSLACSLEPARKGLHRLHEQIVQARITQRFGGY